MQAPPSAPELVALYWTVSGPVEIGTGREWSLFDIADRAAAAARVGFSGLGIWHADLEHILERRSLRELKQILDDHGLKHLELEFLSDWFLDPGDGRRKAADATRRLLFEAAGVLEPHHVKVGNLPRRPWPLTRITERFAELCADAARHTSATLVYELMPFDAQVVSLETVLQVVEGAAAVNGGVAIDTWHMGKLGIAPDDLRRIPPAWLRWVELSDGRRGLASGLTRQELSHETLNHRALPGEGELGVRGYVDACRAHGYTGPWGVEVLSEALRHRPIDEIFQRAYTTTTAQFHNEEERR